MRGGDQVAVRMGGKNQFFGGKAKAVEKHTRVKARVVAHAVREIIDDVGHGVTPDLLPEDFPCLDACVSDNPHITPDVATRIAEGARHVRTSGCPRVRGLSRCASRHRA